MLELVLEMVPVRARRPNALLLRGLCVMCACASDVARRMARDERGLCPPVLVRDDTFSLQQVVVQHLSSVGAEPMCVVCLERPRTMAIFPCRHRCLCTVDARHFEGPGKACPICRGPVTSVLAIFDA